MRIAALRRCVSAAAMQWQWRLNGNDRRRAQQNSGDAVVHLRRDAWVDAVWPDGARATFQICIDGWRFDFTLLDVHLRHGFYCSSVCRRAVTVAGRSRFLEAAAIGQAARDCYLERCANQYSDLLLALN